VRFARCGSRESARKAVRCINIFTARQRAASAVVVMVKTLRPVAIRRRRRSQIKIGDVAKTLIPSAFLYDEKKFAIGRAGKIIFRAILPPLPRNAARAASDGGAYTQN
jgi:hypothetical protein